MNHYIDTTMQPTMNIGTLGHVAHGKTSLVRIISGVDTAKFKKELERNMTIKLGYTNAKIFKCSSCPKPKCYQSGFGATRNLQCKHCSKNTTLVRHISFVDCPGHEQLMSCMLNGTAVMDGALLVISAEKNCPQPQTEEHLVAAEIMNLKNIIVVQNKIDLVDADTKQENYEEIQKLIKGTIASKSPIISTSVINDINIDTVLQHIVETIPMPIKDYQSKPVMTIIRSFDINKPGLKIKNLKGAVIGGTIEKGVLSVGDIIEIKPGLLTKKDGKTVSIPIKTRIISIYSDKTSLKTAGPGGLIAIGTQLDPCLAREDKLIGNVVGLFGHLPPIRETLNIKYRLLKGKGRIANNETVMVTIGSLNTTAVFHKYKKRYAKIVLNRPVCTEIGNKCSISKKIDKLEGWRLIGFGEIVEKPN